MRTQNTIINRMGTITIQTIQYVKHAVLHSSHMRWLIRFRAKYTVLLLFLIFFHEIIIIFTGKMVGKDFIITPKTICSLIYFISCRSMHDNPRNRFLYEYSVGDLRGMKGITEFWYSELLAVFVWGQNQKKF